MNNPMMVLCMISDLEKQMVFRVNLFILVRSVRCFRSKDWSSALLAIRSYVCTEIKNQVL